LAFFPYIRNAALEEVDAKGTPVPAATRLIVFPGIELTLALPCQAIVVFDPDSADESLNAAMHALGIEQAPAADSKSKEVQKLRFISLEELCDTLNALSSIKGRFILLPNVNDGGSDTILRQDFSEHYKTMPCVGGYVDGLVSGHSKSNITNGKDPAWGNKKVGVIQTSDAREADFSKLGTASTWIKWSSPTTEAIRQACLSPASRIRYSEPLIPDTWIAAMEVSASRYFGPFSVEFNPQANMIIGGRGTGKSTVLEYLRWALCDQPYVHSGEGESELPNFEKRRRSLVSGTLEPEHGSVAVSYVRNGVLHSIRREAGTNKVHLKIGDQAEQETTEEVIQSLAQIQGYSQKQLSHVSVRTQELERLLSAPVAPDLAVVDADLKSLASSLRQAFEKRESKRTLQEQLQTIELDLASKKQQADSLTQQVKDLPEELRKEIDAHPFYSEGERIAEAYRLTLSHAKLAATNFETSVRKLIDDLPSVGRGLPSPELTSIRAAVVAGLESALNPFESLAAQIISLATQTREQFDSAAAKLSAHKGTYDAAASENNVVQERLGSLKSVSELIEGSERDRVLLNGKIELIGDTQKELSLAREDWLKALGRKRSLLAKQAAALEADSGGQLRVSIGPPQNAQFLVAMMQNAVSGAGITRTEKFEAAVSSVVSAATPIIAWLELCEELIALARVGPRLDSGAALPSAPRLRNAQFIEAELVRIAVRLKPNAAFELSLIHPESAPVFEYKTAQGSYAPFQEASPGQQATALISLLLNQTAGALVVDQPEDDLDNLTIIEVAQRLWSAKEKRQLIFSTHNPNLVVIGDAELVLHCAYSASGGPVRLQISNQGAIDNPTICGVITKVMEGGEAAFSLRRQKYGF
jgi:chromosome segregation protein